MDHALRAGWKIGAELRSEAPLPTTFRDWTLLYISPVGAILCVVRFLAALLFMPTIMLFFAVVLLSMARSFWLNYEILIPMLWYVSAKDMSEKERIKLSEETKL